MNNNTLTKASMENISIISASEARKEWSRVIDDAIYSKPQFIRRTRDNVVMTNVNLLSDLLDPYRFTANKYVEEDGSITLSLNEIDLVVNASTEKEAVQNLASDIQEYAKDYYEEYHIWSSAPNRKKHFPYVLKALILDISSIGEEIHVNMERT
jgi:hypothetical protein